MSASQPLTRPLSVLLERKTLRISNRSSSLSEKDSPKLSTYPLDLLETSLHFEKYRLIKYRHFCFSSLPLARHRTKKKSQVLVTLKVNKVFSKLILALGRDTRQSKHGSSALRVVCWKSSYILKRRLRGSCSGWSRARGESLIGRAVAVGGVGRFSKTWTNETVSSFGRPLGTGRHADTLVRRFD